MLTGYKLNYDKLKKLGEDDSLHPSIFGMITDCVECYLGMNNGCGTMINLPGSIEPTAFPSEQMIELMKDCGVLEKVK